MHTSRSLISCVLRLHVHPQHDAYDRLMDQRIKAHRRNARAARIAPTSTSALKAPHTALPGPNLPAPAFTFTPAPFAIPSSSHNPTCPAVANSSGDTFSFFAPVKAISPEPKHLSLAGGSAAPPSFSFCCVSSPRPGQQGKAGAVAVVTATTWPRGDFAC